MEKNIIKMQTENLNLFYGRFHALKSVNLFIREQSITSIIGPSGCGKSTLLRVFNRMNDYIPNIKIEGKVTVNNEDIYSAKCDVVNLRKKVGMVFQKPNPFPMSVFDNVAYGVKIHKIVSKGNLAKIVEKSLKQVLLWDELKDKLNCSALEISLGQQQRLCIARLLAVEPEVILLDEPCSALDPISTLALEDLMRELKKQYTIVIVTHSMQQAARVSDYTAFMLLGELIEYNTTKEVFSNPKNKKTEDYITGRYG